MPPELRKASWVWPGPGPSWKRTGVKIKNHLGAREAAGWDGLQEGA